MKEFAKIEWERARKALDSARQLAESDPESAASRAYYAAFHALTGFFAARGQTFTKHAAILVTNGMEGRSWPQPQRCGLFLRTREAAFVSTAFRNKP